MAAVPAYSDVGKTVKEILTGGRSGVYSLNHKLTATTKTADGVALAFNALNKGDKLDLSVRSTFPLPLKGYSLAAVVNASDKVALTLTGADVAGVAGLRATLTAAVPDAASGKLALDWAHRSANVRVSSTLTTQPNLSLAATTAVKGLLLGATADYSTGKAALTDYGLALGYHAGDSQVAAILADRAETLTLRVAHAVSKDKMFAAEASRPLAGGAGAETSFTVGLAQTLEGGALVKAKVDHKGVLTALYEQRLASGERVALSTQLDTRQPTAPPKVGVALDLA
jgi:hypothetical protein